MELLTITQSDVLELASKLADKKLMDNLLNGLIHDPKDEPVFIEQENGDTRYSERMQDEFNELYDYYLTMIEQTLNIYLDE